MQTTTPDLVICSECRTGNYRIMLAHAYCTNSACGHIVNINADVKPYLDGRTLTATATNLLATVDAPEPTTCIDCDSPNVSDPDPADGGMIDCYTCGAAWIPGKR